MMDGTDRGSKLPLMHVFAARLPYFSLRQGDTSCENNRFRHSWMKNRPGLKLFPSLVWSEELWTNADLARTLTDNQ